MRLEDEYSDDLINAVFRHVHTLKGSSGIAGFDTVSEFSHACEDLMDYVRSEKLRPDKALVDLLLHGLDWIYLAIFEADTDPERLEATKKLLTENLSQYLTSLKGRENVSENGASVPADREGSEGFRFYHVSVRFNEEIFTRGIDPLLIMEDLFSLGDIIQKKAMRNIPDFDVMDPEKCYLEWDIILKTDQLFRAVQDVFIFVQDDNEIDIEDITDDFISEEGPLTEKRLGEILVKRGIVTDEELDELIIEQKESNRRFGEMVVEKGFASEKEIDEALGNQEKIRRRIETGTVRVETGRLDLLVNLLGELVIGQASMSRMADELDDEKGMMFTNTLHGLDRITRQFQEQIMAIRMIPIGPTFEQFRRFTRDTSRLYGKEIKLVIEGQETKLDKNVIEKIDDPLRHMMRNAIDHGIESPEERKAAGKEPAGTITLRAFHQEGNVYIEISDDGRGIEEEKVRQKALAMGLIKEDETVNRSKLLSFLCLPGFSTSEVVDEISGRGVGMDVVNTNVEELRGTIELESEQGQGTTCRIKLPLTLAIIDGMLMSVGDYVYIVPMLAIIESLQPTKEQVNTLEGKNEVISVRGEYVPLIRLYQLFGVPSEVTEVTQSLVVVVESGNDKVALMVDELLGQQQIVIKSIDQNITESRALSGAAILGDGRVALILDVHGIIAEIQNRRIHAQEV